MVRPFSHFKSEARGANLYRLSENCFEYQMLYYVLINHVNIRPKSCKQGEALFAGFRL